MDDQFIREGSAVANLMKQHGLSFVAFSPLAQARLLDKFDPTKPPQFEPGDHRRNRLGFVPKGEHDRHQNRSVPVDRIVHRR